MTRLRLGALALCGMIAAVTGCASKSHKPSPAQTQFVAGQEEAFMMLQRSGIHVVRMSGPFERPVVLWHEGMTLAQAILNAGYLDQGNPSRIIIQRGPTALTIDPATLLQGKDVAVVAGDVIHVLP